MAAVSLEHSGYSPSKHWKASIQLLPLVATLSASLLAAHSQITVAHTTTCQLIMHTAKFEVQLLIKLRLIAVTWDDLYQ